MDLTFFWGALGWLLLVIHGCLDGNSRARAWQQIGRLQRLKFERDCLADWLSVNGWRMEFLDDRVVIVRREDDPEEALLRAARQADG
jgi:hypothetical protein